MIIGVVVLIACLWSTYGPQIPWLLSRALCCKPQNNVLESRDYQILAMPTKPRVHLEVDNLYLIYFLPDKTISRAIKIKIKIKIVRG